MNEFELIKTLKQNAPESGNSLVKGIGDDCAVLAGSESCDFLVTTDALFEGVHFKLDWTTPRTLGRKALSSNLSDIAAMGGRPLYYLASVGIPKGFPNILEVFEGMAQVAANYRTTLIGGDTCSSASGFLLSLTIIGEVERGHCCFRRGAQVGDSVYVTGALGEAALGMVCLEKGMRNIEVRQFLKRHNDPTPRISTGQWLSASSCISAMIDVSDGLVSDLGHIAESSGVGIVICKDKLPMSKDFIDTAVHCHKDPFVLALSGGEDYELAFTVSSSKTLLFERMISVMIPAFGHSVTKIGKVVEDRGIKVLDAQGQEMPMAHGGFEHRF